MCDAVFKVTWTRVLLTWFLLLFIILLQLWMTYLNNCKYDWHRSRTSGYFSRTAHKNYSLALPGQQGAEFFPGNLWSDFILKCWLHYYKILFTVNAHIKNKLSIKKQSINLNSLAINVFLTGKLFPRVAPKFEFR